MRASAGKAMRHLDKYHIVLGSQSPRRVELLSGLDLEFEQRAIPDIDESYPQTLAPEIVPEYLARHKAAVYAPKLASNELLITADTIVLLDGEVLGKPRTTLAAQEMLRHLSGRMHRVITGVCVCTQDRIESFSCTTNVYFAEMSSRDIAYYVNKYNPKDKAGAYGIQEWIGYRFISRIEGSYYNVMGLPVHELAEVLTSF